MYTTTLQQATDGDLFIEVPASILEQLDMNEGDELEWEDNEDGTYTMRKIKLQETELVLVKTIKTYVHEYALEVPKGQIDYALDTVVMGDAIELTHNYLDESIVHYGEITRESIIEKFIESLGPGVPFHNDDIIFDMMVTKVD